MVTGQAPRLTPCCHRAQFPPLTVLHYPVTLLRIIGPQTLSKFNTGTTTKVNLGERKRHCRILYIKAIVMRQNTAPSQEYDTDQDCVLWKGRNTSNWTVIRCRDLKTEGNREISSTKWRDMFLGTGDVDYKETFRLSTCTQINDSFIVLSIQSCDSFANKRLVDQSAKQNDKSDIMPCGSESNVATSNRTELWWRQVINTRKISSSFLNPKPSITAGILCGFPQSCHWNSWIWSWIGNTGFFSICFDAVVINRLAFKRYVIQAVESTVK